MRSRLKALKARAAEVAAAREDLVAAVEAAPHLFEKPKTQTADGVKFGWMKQRGSIDISTTRP